MLYYRKSEDNKTSILIKNPTKAEYERHAPKLISKVPEHLILKCKKDKSVQIDILVYMFMLNKSSS